MDTVLDAFEAKAGDAAPLLIYEPRLMINTVQHSTPWPLENNTITVRFKTNVPILLKAQRPDITISGLVDTRCRILQSSTPHPTP